MKSAKALVVAAALALSMGCAGTAFAAGDSATLDSVTAPGNSQDIEVKGTYSSSATVETVYSVDITWEDMTAFQYSLSGTLTWNPSDHTYSDGNSAVSGTWTNTATSTNGAAITVTNHSNAPVNANFAFAKASGVEGTYVGTFDNATAALERGVEGQYNTAPFAKSTLSFSGSLAEYDQSVQLGTAKVSLSAPQQP